MSHEATSEQEAYLQDSFTAALNHWKNCALQMKAERDEARAEAERLHNLLRELADNMNEHGTPNATAAYYRSVDLTRAALSPSPPDSKEGA